ncbi:uncharacterized protein EV422DRAFT_525061 [Fimicolochytrium jonesii]|uniref:uncharacterized protein n=1 Tax=Fimicolochytrium jonesii TaxID=1396493 RepID=UPI0022FF110D|nr:uncharacterized protein EV422DRAFT_525061 [Fimicolochytrium jonesii]KAI8822701.1 hypothetical protein EV422DRAFT_525061 [Fimicolochytrium jonesii]
MSSEPLQPTTPPSQPQLGAVIGLSVLATATTAALAAIYFGWVANITGGRKNAGDDGKLLRELLEGEDEVEGKKGKKKSGKKGKKDGVVEVKEVRDEVGGVEQIGKKKKRKGAKAGRSTSPIASEAKSPGAASSRSLSLETEPVEEEEENFADLLHLTTLQKPKTTAKLGKDQGQLAAIAAAAEKAAKRNKKAKLAAEHAAAAHATAVVQKGAGDVVPISGDAAVGAADVSRDAEAAVAPAADEYVPTAAPVADALAVDRDVEISEVPAPTASVSSKAVEPAVLESRIAAKEQPKTSAKPTLASQKTPVNGVQTNRAQNDLDALSTDISALQSNTHITLTEVTALNARLTDSTQTIATLLTEKAASQTQIDTLTNQLQQLQDKLERQDAEVEIVRTTNRHLTEGVNRLHLDVREAEERAQRAVKAATKATDADALLHDEIADLRSQLQTAFEGEERGKREAETAVRDVETKYESQIARDEATISRLAQELTAEREKTDGAVKRLTQEFTTERELHAAEVAALRGQLHHSTQQANETEQRIQHLHAELTNATADRDTQIEHLRSQVEEKSEEVGKVEFQHRAEIESLRGENGRLASVVERLTGEVEEVKALRGQLGQLADEKKRVEEELKEAREKIAVAVGEKENAEKAASEARDQLALVTAEKEKLEKEGSEFRTQLTTVNEQHQALQTQLDACRKALSDAKTEAEKTFTETRTELADLTRRVEELTAELTQAKTDQQRENDLIGQLSVELQMSQANLKTVQQQLEEVKAERDALTELSHAMIAVNVEEIERKAAEFKGFEASAREEQQEQPAIEAEGEKHEAVESEVLDSVAADSDRVADLGGPPSASIEDSDAGAEPATYTHTFHYPHPGTSVLVTGTFDDWSSSVHLDPSTRSATISIPREKTADGKVVYKFVVDGVWCVDAEARVERDEMGVENNVVYL